MYEELESIAVRKPDSLMGTRGKDARRRFTEEDLQMANTHMQRCSVSLAVREGNAN